MATCVDHRVPSGGVPARRQYRLNLLGALEELFFPQMEENINTGHPESHIVERKSARIRQQSYPLMECSEFQGQRKRCGNTHRVYSVFLTQLALGVDGMVTNDVLHAGDDQNLTIWRAVQKVCQVFEELLSERVGWKLVNVAIPDCRMRAIDEWPDL